MDIMDSVENYNRIKIKCNNCNSMVRRDFMSRHRKTSKCIDNTIIIKSKIDKIDIDINLLKLKIVKLEDKKKELLLNINEPN
jgi:hypothetical protein